MGSEGQQIWTVPQLAGRVQEVPDWVFSYPVPPDPGHLWACLFFRLHWLDLVPSLLALASQTAKLRDGGTRRSFLMFNTQIYDGAKRGEGTANFRDAQRVILPTGPPTSWQCY